MDYHKTYFTQRCPNSSEYEAYLNGSASNELIIAFEQHLSECELCSAAVEGYKSTALTQPISSTKTINFKKWLSYAAAIVVLISSGLLLLDQKKMVQENSMAMNLSFDQTTHASKRLNHKSDAEFWYLGKNTIELNDQFISLPEIKETRNVNPNSKQIMIEVENNTSAPNEIIESIKNNNTLPVFTFSKTNGLKKN